jgi:hypothetical protein
MDKHGVVEIKDEIIISRMDRQGDIVPTEKNMLCRKREIRMAIKN